MSRIGVLVLGSFGPRILDRVIASLDSKRFKFFLHVDRKNDLAAYLAHIADPDRVTLVQHRVDVYWGGYSMIEAELALARAALQYPDLSHMVLLSDDSAPIASHQRIYDLITTGPDRITCVANGRPRHWYLDFFYPDSRFGSLRGHHADEKQFTAQDFINIQRMERLRLRGKKEIPAMFFGRQWWALKRESLAAILDYVDGDEHFTESFRFSLFPDETFFPTAYRICFPDKPTLDIPTYADYGRHVHPWLFTSAKEIQSVAYGPEHLFVRKIKQDAPEIVDQIFA